MPAPFFASLVLAAAQCFNHVPEVGGDNHGQMVELFLKFVGLPAGEPWCAAALSYIGHNALLDLDTGKSLWPLPLTGGCAVLGDFAAKHNALTSTPSAGMVFLVFEPSLKRFGHTGFVRAVAGHGSLECTTCEGNTTADGSRNGWEYLCRTRTFDLARGDRFIDWVKLVGQN